MRTAITISLLLLLTGGCEKGLDPADDSTLPVVSITSPSNNTTVGDSAVVQVLAVDEGGIAEVTLYGDGLPLLTRTTVPWRFTWTTGSVANKSIHLLTARAEDPAGNVGFSSPVTVTVNRPERGLDFNGITDYITLPSSPTLTSFGEQITLEAWVRLASYGSGAVLLTSGNENEYSLTALLGGRAEVFMAMLNQPTGARLTSQVVLPLDTWRHVAARYDGDSLTIYIDGVADASMAATGTVSSSQIVENISIGVFSSGNHVFHDNYLEGIIDEVRIWNVARSATEIQQSRNSELVGTETGLVGYWKLDGNALDVTASANHGTIFGFPQTVTINR